MSKHTPGPWTIETVRTQVGHCHKIGPFPGSCGRNVGHACVYVDGYHAPDARTGNVAELLANARLIAAAPDLLYALEVLLGEAMNFSVQDVSFAEKCMGHKGPALAVAAISKATEPAP